MAGLIENLLFRSGTLDVSEGYRRIRAAIAEEKAERFGAGQNSLVSIGRLLFVVEFHTSSLTWQEPL